MKTSVLALLLVSSLAASAQNIITQDVATVVNVTPIIELVRESGECTQYLSQYSNQYAQRCEPDVAAERTVGYRVTYRYQGIRTTTTLPFNPGPTLPVTITVTPTQRPSYQQPQSQFQRF